MSTNCVVCITNKRTGSDLLCDACRELENSHLNRNVLQQAAETLIDMCGDYLQGGITDETFVNNLAIFSDRCTEEMVKPGS